jgi:hypothetical protein
MRRIEGLSLADRIQFTSAPFLDVISTSCLVQFASVRTKYVGIAMQSSYVAVGRSANAVGSDEPRETPFLHPRSNCMEQGIARIDVCDYSPCHGGFLELKGTSSCAHMTPQFTLPQPGEFNPRLRTPSPQNPLALAPSISAQDSQGVCSTEILSRKCFMHVFISCIGLATH